MPPLLSIVVPVYNVEPYLQECLESLQNQTMDDFEVIMVDDGSTDGSAAIAKEFASRDGRFRLIQQENQGPGPARNTGVRHATGTYLAFVDGDDVVPPNAYQRMINSLEKSGSDFACGGVRRFSSKGIYPSKMHADIFDRPAKKTHISRRPELVGDRTPWNKVYRKSFWDAHNFQFPRGLYEDPTVAIPAHVLAEKVDVLSIPVYHWRVREGGERSITQRRTEPGNLEDRVTAIRRVSKFLREHAPELMREYMSRVFADKLPMYIEVLHEGSEHYRQLLQKAVEEFAAEADEEIFQELPALKRLKYHLLRRGMIDELLEVLVFQQREIITTDVVLRGGRWYARYPYFDDPERGIPDSVYDITDEVTLQAGVDRAYWREGRLYIEGFAYIARIPVPDPYTGSIRLWLRHPEEENVVELPVGRIYRPRTSADAKWAAACYDWAGFSAVLDPATLGQRRFGFQRRFRPGLWRLEVEVTMPGGVRRSGPLRGSTRADQRWPSGHDVAPGVSMRVSPSRQSFGLEVVDVGARVTAARPVEGAIEIEGHVVGGGKATELLLSRPNGTGEIRLPILAHGKGRFLGRIPMDVLPEWEETPGQDRLPWNVLITVAGRQEPIQPVAADHVETWQAKGSHEAALTRIDGGYLRVIQRRCRPVLTEARWTDRGVLRLRGRMTGDRRPAELVARWRAGAGERRMPLSWDGEEFTAELQPMERTWYGDELPMRSGRWDLVAPLGEDDEVSVYVARSACVNLPEPHVVGIHEFTLVVEGMEEPWVWVRPAHDPTERGAYGIKRMSTEDYPVYRRSPIRDMALFESFQGRQFSDSPRAIFEELRRRHPEFEYVWVTSDGRFQPPEGVRTLLRGTREHLKAMAQARFLVSNDPMPYWMEKRPEQIYLQTWHGTPLKKLGYDIERPAHRNPQDYLRRFGRDMAQWNALVSPNPFSSPIWRRAFRYEGELLEIGYPRNDILFRPEQAERIRRRLGLPAGKRVVLYAPTWRDDRIVSNGYGMELQLDVERAREVLGEDHVLLIRGHINVVGNFCPPDDDFVRNVSTYPDIAELYLVSDVLVTDYSSAMFDYACTARPILFFTYDLEHYRDELRGFYFDFEAEAPGPMCMTSDELIDALRDVGNVSAQYEHRYEAFREKFCPWDDGGAAARAVDWLLQQ
ncbi:bifunctional glycosyltransferase/CDP-glycerol:glycerophosphate glycerophosphotransferase [Thermomonospora curvata]|uniref:CDP-glycerol:poly(Glycerophosphate)glycerophosph otransferase n=1 Tax=Thermomonospora curvata (strain ATCC 19995 / DSM 43183 / JCM 3096 / KCTC 9072 / NBRC 15933 / NCIMB 10081 / Henssen B9) TaxID=471852 RepID=D1A4K2_THECD|nr:bifunctional glycosyltransferase family 2 protein/CDP-glycerol:glycerophosphate glycerophosphotransferase [Thermomonospora curvata]ACY96237.1 CDP-glycerol:poly(glycerophosphate)glycerophosph otransferase [Thermomonospora curvata DSM 43183]